MGRVVIKPIFSSEPSIGARILALVLAALLLMLADWRLGLLAPGRAVFGDAAVPLYWIGNLPAQIADWFEEVFATRESLVEENRTLRAEALVLRARTQRLAALAAENVRLRELLHSTALLDEKLLVAEIIGVSPDLGNQTVVIDKGSSQGLARGQAVIDAYGLFGQIVEVGRFSSRVLLLTDTTHAVPAQVVRNGVRLIVEGTGRIDVLDVNHVSSNMDVRPGDLLVSSGLGQRFPGGYPVAVVESVTNDAGRIFAVVQARPSAQLDRSRHVMVVTVAADSAVRETPTTPDPEPE
ncbi:MAG: rod shape-determining protein MreC [Pseudomonadales bacterium]|nr:rod shape-determining protein MreC [Pseudomonadales bacterium]